MAAGATAGAVLQLRASGGGEGDLQLPDWPIQAQDRALDDSAATWGRLRDGECVHNSRAAFISASMRSAPCLKRVPSSPSWHSSCSLHQTLPAACSGRTSCKFD